jgi:hypothetical protein
MRPPNTWYTPSSLKKTAGTAWPCSSAARTKRSAALDSEAPHGLSVMITNSFIGLSFVF